LAARILHTVATPNKISRRRFKNERQWLQLLLLRLLLVKLPVSTHHLA